MRELDRRFTLPEDAKTCLYQTHVNVPFAGLRSHPKPSQSLDMELVYGQGFDVHAEKGRWLFGRVRSLQPSARETYVGYVEKRCMARGLIQPTHIVSTICAPVFRRDDMKSPIKFSLPMNAWIETETSDSLLLNMPGIGYVHSAHIRPIDELHNSDFVDIAMMFLGRPYIWGGNGGVGVDCSALVQMSLAAVGRDCPRDADQQEAHLGHKIELDAIRRGDLIFWPGHVGIMADPKTLLHANAHHMVTATEPLKKAIQRIGPPRSIKRL